MPFIAQWHIRKYRCPRSSRTRFLMIFDGFWSKMTQKIEKPMSQSPMEEAKRPIIDVWLLLFVCFWSKMMKNDEKSCIRNISILRWVSCYGFWSLFWKMTLKSPSTMFLRSPSIPRTSSEMGLRSQSPLRGGEGSGGSGRISPPDLGRLLIDFLSFFVIFMKFDVKFWCFWSKIDKISETDFGWFCCRAVIKDLMILTVPRFFNFDQKSSKIGFITFGWNLRPIFDVPKQRTGLDWPSEIEVIVWCSKSDFEINESFLLLLKIVFTIFDEKWWHFWKSRKIDFSWFLRSQIC